MADLAEEPAGPATAAAEPIVALLGGMSVDLSPNGLERIGLNPEPEDARTDAFSFQMALASSPPTPLSSTPSEAL